MSTAKVQARLRAGETVELEGVAFKYAGEADALEAGDWYAAERNVGPRLLTVREVQHGLGAVFPVENAYPYDLGECVKVVPAGGAS